MAQAGLALFLNEFLKDMGNLDPELRESYDLEPIIFRFEPADLSSIMIKAAKAQKDWQPTREDISFMVTKADEYGKDIKRIILDLGGHPFGTAGCRLRFTVETNIRAFPGGGDWRQYGKDAILKLPQSSFNKIKTSYRTTLQNYFKELQDKFAEQNTGKTKAGRQGKGGFRTAKGKRMGKGQIGSIINLGHIDGVLETSVQRTLENTYKTHEQALKNLGIKDLAQLKRQMKRAGISLKVVRDNDDEGFETRLEFAGDNKSAGNKAKRKKKVFLQACTDTANRLGSKIGSIKGSDSILDRNRKIIIKEIAKKFKKRKGVVVRTENTKLKTSKGSATKKIGNPKFKAGKTITGGVVNGLVRKARRKSKKQPMPPKMALANILGVINDKLPERVAANMGSPGLENRTGRFAQSVRATDVTQTPQGFPSIGYTYMKDRYGVYESTSGTRFADADRDPRPLIDQSIREIAAGFALGRLYTRRL